MARPKLPNTQKKVKMNLTVTQEVKDMTELVRIEKNISMSEFFEDCVKKEYRKLTKNKE